MSGRSSRSVQGHGCLRGDTRDIPIPSWSPSPSLPCAGDPGPSGTRGGHPAGRRAGSGLCDVARAGRTCQALAGPAITAAPCRPGLPVPGPACVGLLHRGARRRGADVLPSSPVP